MANLHEIIGRLTVQHEDECAQHRRTVDILREVSKGNIRPAALKVRADHSWEIIDLPPAPAEDLAAVPDTGT